MRKLSVLVALVALAVLLATLCGGWKWGGSTTKQAGWTWDDGHSSYVWAE
jgi:ABC-type glycerol-3-phosphate transport system substrate-binding protein